MTIKELKNKLTEVGYIPTDDIVYAVSGTINRQRPLLIEGDPGVGKTSLAKAVAEMMGIPLYRVQFYEGVTADKILYDINYQKQLLTIQTIQSTVQKELADVKSIEEAIQYVGKMNFYGEDFLIKRPVLLALTSEIPCVLLLDEIDKSSEEIEYTLLEMLDEFSITIPEYGTVKAAVKPMVFLTSNNYREISDTLKRRCGYLYIKQKSESEMYNILISKIKCDSEIIKGVAKCIYSISKLQLKQQPSIAEVIDWTNEISEYPDNIRQTLSVLLKNHSDQEKVLKSNALDSIISAANN